MGWQEVTGYGRRALVETAMGHYKGIIGARLRARGEAPQRTEAIVGVAVLNHVLDAGGATLSVVRPLQRRHIDSPTSLDLSRSPQQRGKTSWRPRLQFKRVHLPRAQQAGRALGRVGGLAQQVRAPIADVLRVQTTVFQEARQRPNHVDRHRL